MTNIFDYLKWRGDLSFTQDPPNPIDAVIFATLTYPHYQGTLKEQPNSILPLRQVAEEFLKREDYMSLVRGKADADFLEAAAESRRFGEIKIGFYREELNPLQDTQFGAATFFLDDGSLFLAFRGTDRSLTGWKEDFNMSFQQTIPAQRMSVAYTREVLAEHTAPVRITGHSKGGNMAIFAAARSSPLVQKWILDVYNNDGPGFSKYMMGDPGYLAMVPRIHSYVPQSSVIGMLMDHEEPYTVIHSDQVGIWQHDVFSWEVVGKDFVHMDALTADSVFVRDTIRTWLSGMDHEERGRMVDVLFGLLETGSVNTVMDIFQPKNIRLYLKTIGADTNTRNVLYQDLRGLITAARATRAAQSGKREPLRLRREEKPAGLPQAQPDNHPVQGE